jgi:hypothetical protein
MIASDALRQRRAPIDRSADRRVALLAIVVAVAFLVAALASLTLPQTTRLGAWLPIHLALAGGATTAIAGVMPFFVAAFAAAPPSDARLRGLAVTAVALGTAAISVGVPADGAGLAAVGGAVFLAGIALTGMATLRPLRGALGPSRGPVIQGYVLALAEVGVGASIATLFLAGWPPVVDGWASLKPAHAWLNLVGFVSLVIATTLLHFFPTVIGARIAVHPSARLTVVGLAAGAPLVAAGFVTGWDWLARVGALGVLGGTVSLAVYVGRAWQRRARWTTDHDWHRFAMGGLISSVIWLELAGERRDRSADRRLGGVGHRRVRHALAAGRRSGRSGHARPTARAPGAVGERTTGSLRWRRAGDDRRAPGGIHAAGLAWARGHRAQPACDGRSAAVRRRDGIPSGMGLIALRAGLAVR